MQLILNEKKKIKKLFYENGWVKIQSFFTKREIKKINKELNLFVKNIAPKLKPGEIHYSKKKINTIHVLDKYSKFFKKLLHSKKVSRLAENIIDDKVVPQWAQFFAKPAKEGMAAPPHQDNYYWCLRGGKSLTFWIALDQSNKKNGGIYYYNGSHKIGLVPHKDSNIMGSSQKVKNIKILKKFKKKTPSLKIGDVLIHDSQIIHGSTKNISNKNRMGLTIQFQSIDCKIDKKKQLAYLASLKNQIKKRLDKI